MLSYRHAFHAGNHADVLKHSVLTLLLDSLLKKDKPFTVFDTHGGGGVYQLDSEGLLHTGEARSGVITLLNHADRNPPPAAALPYLRLAGEYAERGLYPGSPEIGRRMMRRQDKLFVAELHPTEIEVLRGNMDGAGPALKSKGLGGCGEPSLTIRHESGFAMLRSCLPPQAKRGLILMDPSYETASDYTEPSTALALASRKWETAIIALWYPLLSHRQRELDSLLCRLAEGFSRACRHNGDRPVLTAELQVAPSRTSPPPSQSGEPGRSQRKATRLYGSGMMVLNCPYRLEEQLGQLLPYLADALAPQAGSWEVRRWD